MLISGDTNGYILLRKININGISNEPFAVLYDKLEHPIKTVSISHDDKYIIAGHYDGDINVWHLEDNKYKLMQTIKSNINSSVSVAFSKAKYAFASARYDGEIKTWVYDNNEFRQQKSTKIKITQILLTLVKVDQTF